MAKLTPHILFLLITCLLASFEYTTCFKHPILLNLALGHFSLSYVDSVGTQSTKTTIYKGIAATNGSNLAAVTGVPSIKEFQFGNEESDGSIVTDGKPKSHAHRAVNVFVHILAVFTAVTVALFF